MDRHARSPPPVFRRVWRENAPLSRLSRLSPSTAGHESRGGGPKTPLLLPSPPYCRAVLSRQSWPRNAISMGFFWGACAEAAIIPASPPGPSSPLFSDGHSILSLSFSLSRDNFSRNFSLSRWELEFYIYSIDEEFVNREREIERVAWSISELIYSYDWFLFTFYWEGEGRGGMWIREDGRSRPSLAGLDTGVFARYVTGRRDKSTPLLLLLSLSTTFHWETARARARVWKPRRAGALSLPPPLVSPIHGGAHLERDERAAGEPTRPLTDRVRLLGPLFEATEKSRRCCCPRLFFSLSQPFKQPNYCPIDIDVLDRITPTGTTIRIFGPFFSPPSSFPFSPILRASSFLSWLTLSSVGSDEEKGF